MKIMLLGAPGVGKGTVAKKLMAALGLPQLSTGDMLREAAKAGSTVGLSAKKYMDAGALVPDDIVIGVIRERLEAPDVAAGFILDGFPRTIPQAEALSNVAELDLVLQLAASDATIIERLSGRRMGPDGTIYHIVNFPPPPGVKVTQRADDSEKAIAERLVVYRRQTEPLIRYYRERGILRDIDAEKTRTIEQVVESCQAEIARISR